MNGEERAVALVTGANKGIGREIAGQLAALGMTVLLGARDPRRREDAARTLRSAGLDVRPIALDVTDLATVRAAEAYVDERFGRLDMLVNNAGISGDVARQAPSTADMGTLREVFETNFFGVIGVTNAMIPLLLRSPAPRIVNVTSSLGSLARMTDPGDYRAGLPAMAAYAPSKTALNSLTVQYAKELRKHNVLINLADPGATDTDFIRGSGLRVTRTAAQGAAIAVRLATLGPDGPTGGFFNDEGLVPW